MTDFYMSNFYKADFHIAQTNLTASIKGNASVIKHEKRVF